MTRSTYRMIHFNKLRSLGDLGVTIARLMIVCNDMNYLQDYLSYLHGNKNLHQLSEREDGKAGYFIRLQMASFSEGLGIIKEIPAEQLNSCSEATQKGYSQLMGLLKGCDKSRTLLAQLRSNSTHHYFSEKGSKKIIRKIIADKAETSETSTYSFGTDIVGCHFEAGDRIQFEYSDALFKKASEQGNTEHAILLREKYGEFLKFATSFILEKVR